MVPAEETLQMFTSWTAGIAGIAVDQQMVHISAFIIPADLADLTDLPFSAMSAFSEESMSDFSVVCQKEIPVCHI